MTKLPFVTHHGERQQALSEPAHAFDAYLTGYDAAFMDEVTPGKASTTFLAMNSTIPGQRPAGSPAF